MKVNKLKFLGAMMFLTILMDVVPYFGFLNVGSISITNLHIPAILTAIVVGPLCGAGIGFLFGLISLMRAVSRESTILDILLQNPFISILPRILFPLIAGYLFRFLRDLSKGKYLYLAVTVSSAAGSLCNSLLVLAALYLTYPQKLIDIFNLSGSSGLFRSLMQAFTPNMLIETLTCIVVSLMVVSACRKKQDPGP